MEADVAAARACALRMKAGTCPGTPACEAALFEAKEAPIWAAAESPVGASQRRLRFFSPSTLASFFTAEGATEEEDEEEEEDFSS